MLTLLSVLSVLLNIVSFNSMSDLNLLEELNILPEDIEMTKKTLLKIMNYGISNNKNISEMKKNKLLNDVISTCFKIINYNKLKKKDQINNQKKTNNKLFQCYICRNNVCLVQSTTCDNCFNINFKKRNIRANLEGKISIVTGGRVKIGFETAIRLLECGSTVVVTTRFPADALARYKAHVNYNNFANRLIIYAMDLRYMKDINDFVLYVYENFDKLDILIHNAAQTIRRPKQFFTHLLTNESSLIQSYKALTNDVDTYVETNNVDTNNVDTNDIEIHSLQKKQSNTLQIINSDTLSVSNIIIPKYDHIIEKIFEPLQNCDDKSLFPENCYDENHEQIDLRTNNTWTQQLGEIEMTECAELLSINTLAPFHMNQQFKNLMAKSGGSYIVNVSSMEGVFNMKNKTNNHPHTNMAKAALNMMTRTSAKTFSKYNIYMVSVDTGWITDEYPVRFEPNDDNTKKRKIDVPLDNLDGACRVLDPVFSYFNGENPVYGVFLKDYVISNW